MEHYITRFCFITLFLAVIAINSCHGFAEQSQGLIKGAIPREKAKALLRSKRSWPWEEWEEEEEEEELENQRATAERNRESGERVRESSWRESNCPNLCWGPYGDWGECSALCGNDGTRVATRVPNPPAACLPWYQTNPCPGNNIITEPCNRFCFNGGTPLNGSCECSPMFRGTCCNTTITCGLPYKPQYGDLHPLQTEYQYQEQVTFSCDTGHIMAGADEAACVNVGGDGAWSKPSPTCTLVVCGEPPHIYYGSYSGNSFTFGDTVDYECDPGYILIGEMSRTCGMDGQWSGSNVTCQRQACIFPGDLVNGEVVPRYQNYEVGSHVSLNCNEGYKLEGASELGCTATGDWNGDMPSCKGVTCGEPEPVVQGEWATSELTYGATIVLHCNNGLKALGDSVKKCQASGTWSGGQPVCSECSQPAQVRGGTLSFSFVDNEVSVKVTCNASMTLIGSQKRTCMPSGVWSGNDAQCQVKNSGNGIPKQIVISIAASGAVLLVLIIIIIIACVCCARKRNKRQNRNGRVQGNTNLAMSDLEIVSHHIDGKIHNGKNQYCEEPNYETNHYYEAPYIQKDHHYEELPHKTKNRHEVPHIQGNNYSPEPYRGKMGKSRTQ